MKPHLGIPQLLLPFLLGFLPFLTSAAEAEAGSVPPYVPTDNKQQLTLGRSPKPRFELKEITWPEAPGEAEICLWKDDKYAAASITIDDNCKPDHQWWLEQGKKHGIKFTWFIITDNVNGKNKGFNGTWEDWQKLVDAGHAVESHTTNHKRSSKTPEDFTRKLYGQSLFALRKHLKEYQATTLAYPMGDGNPKIAGEYFIAARGTRGTINNANQINYLNTNKGGISQPFIDVLLTGRTDDTRLKWLNKKDRGNRRGWITPLYHYVPRGRTPEEKAANKKQAEKEVANLASYKDRIWIDTFPAVAKYAQERDSATLTTLQVETNAVELSLTDRMHDGIFTQPLTVKVRLPETWTAVHATQDGKDVESALVNHDGHPYALVEAIPDKGKIRIQGE